jgi:deoxyribodipyrimidine photo-lyase
MAEQDTLRRDFADRQALIDYLKDVFSAEHDRAPQVSETRGGRAAAEARLAEIDPARYASTRNALNGAVTRLSPYLRHGVLSLDEVRNLALDRAGARAEKLVNELGWRDYWQRVYAEIGDGVWKDREPYKTGLSAADYSDTLPADLAAAETGLRCMDAFVAELYTTGYLHNHARLWLAAYLVHWRRVRWQVGARWFLAHLLDGDPASNNLSWQWVASTFSHKPYLFDRGNLEFHTGGVYCRQCPLADGGCPLETNG